MNLFDKPIQWYSYDFSFPDLVQQGVNEVKSDFVSLELALRKMRNSPSHAALSTFIGGPGMAS